MDKTDAWEGINYQQNKSMTSKEIHEDMTQIIVEDLPYLCNCEEADSRI